MKNSTIVITCEHAGNEIPEKYKNLFSGYDYLLATHRGYDLGILSLAEHFSKVFNVMLYKTTVSRLLVDTNRSLWRRTLFSEISKPLGREEKETILKEYYYKHRNEITRHIEKESENGQKLLHIALHSFTPVLNSTERNAELGFLYDPQRKNEKAISKQWKKSLQKVLPEWRLRFNYPYRGKPDGLTAHFRKMYPDQKYLGVELEINQKFVKPDGSFPEAICNKITDSFRYTLDEYIWQ
jgi:predicted N-formylglutamate amidohydrolase